VIILYGYNIAKINSSFLFTNQCDMYRYVQNRVLTCLKLLLAMTDFLCLNLIFGSTIFLVSNIEAVDLQLFNSANPFSIWVTFNLVLIISSLYLRMYSDSTIEYIEKVFKSTIQTVLSVIFLFAGCALVAHPFDGIIFFIGYLSFFILLYAAFSRFILAYIYSVMPRRYGWMKDIVLIGHNDYVSNVMASFPQNHAFYNVNTILYRDELDYSTKEGKVNQFRRYFEEVSKRGIHEVFLINSPDVSACSRELIMAADHECVQLNFVHAVTARISYGSKQEESISLDLPVLRSHENSLSEMDNRIKKRAVDFIISGLVIVFILSWLIPIVGLIIKIQSPGPIFFKQPRSGRNNRSFNCLKFRSMVINTDSNAKQALKGDDRITPIGHFLRKSSLDEFPQFINVFLGQMSVVGPRPHMLAHTEHYSKLIQHYMVRHFVKPGITGWAQVNGFRGETTKPELMAKRVEYDLEYMNNWSAMLDFKIICMTAWNMVKGEKNAY